MWSALRFMLTINSAAFVLACYWWGAISPAYLVTRWRKGIDLRRYGSGNVGSSNVGEQLGRAWTIAVGLLDWLKGIVPIALARVWGFDAGAVVLAGLATVIGHAWSPYLNFKGGRGMATTVGLLFALDARLALVLLFCIAIGWAVRYSAVGAFGGLMLLAPAAWWFQDARGVVIGMALLALIIAIKRLEANRLPLPSDPREKRAVLWRRLWMDRDVPRGQAWQERGKIQ